MAITLYLIRHGEAEHNVTHDHRILDPPLTPHGIEQAKQIKINGQETAVSASLVHFFLFSSTSQRALQTASIAFPNHQIEASDLFLEYNTGALCNLPSSVELQKQRWPNVDFDTYAISPLPMEKTRDMGWARANRILALVREVGKVYSNVVIVSHGNIIKEILLISGQKEVDLLNCEVVSFVVQ